MASTIPQCRGFTHPFVLLVRSTLRTRSALESPRRTTASSLLTTPSRQRRTLFSGRALFNAKPSTTAAPATKKPVAPLPHVSSANAMVGYARRLASKNQPTTIYEGPSQTGFMISSYGATFFCFGSAAINSWFNVYNLPPGISSWVPVGFGVISLMFAALGTVFALRPSSVIRSIKVLPFEPLKKGAPVGANAQRVLLEVASRRISVIPLPLKRIKVEPERIVMVNPVHQRPVIVSQRTRIMQDQMDIERRRQERQYEMDHLMTAPFRDAKKASSTIFNSVRRGLTGEGFAPVFIDGVRHKMDTEGGFALENGQVLDRLVRIQPDPELARVQSEAKAPQ